MVLGSHAKTRAMYSTPPWPSLAASTAAYRRRSFSDNHPKKRCIFSSISAEYPSMLYSLRHNLLWRKDTTAQACREVIPDHILSRLRGTTRTVSVRHRPTNICRDRARHRTQRQEGLGPLASPVSQVPATILRGVGRGIDPAFLLGPGLLPAATRQGE